MNAAPLWLCAAMRWMLLHGPEGQLYWLNEDQVTTLRAPIPSDLRASFPKDTRCIVASTSGKFVAVIESCEQVYSLMMGAR